MNYYQQDVEHYQQLIGAVYRDIPRIHTAIAQWCACMIYIQLFKKSEKAYISAVKYAGFLPLFIILLVPTANVNRVLWMPIMVLSMLLMYTFISVCCKGKLIFHIYLAACAFLFSELAASLEWLVYYYIGYIRGNRSIITATIIMAIIYMVVFIVTYQIERYILKGENRAFISRTETYRMVIVVISVFLFSNLSFVFPNTPFSSMFFYEGFKLRAYTELLGYVVVVMMQVALKEQSAISELDAIKLMLRNQYEQYLRYQENIEIVNRKYHDIKNQLIAVRAEEDEQRRNALIDEMEGELDSYREHVDTGNPALDALLESKALRAKKSNIELTLVVDGKLLEHIYVVDLCTLFGNALDNAIEVEAISEREEQRLIHLSVSELKGFVIIKVENYMHKPIKLGDSLPRTTKSDSQNHGYGLKSIRYVAEKYNGHMDISMVDNWFVLTVMLPRRK